MTGGHNPGGYLPILRWLPNILFSMNSVVGAVTAAVRAYRYVRRRCLVCGRSVGSSGQAAVVYRYCSIECMAYDGALKDHSKSRILTGKIVPPKPHHENCFDEK